MDYMDLIERQKRESTGERADFHMHTLFSDGSDSVDALFALAKEQGLAALSVTDHDTVLGLPAVKEASIRYGIPFIPGIELTAKEDGKRFHVLGYGIDPHDSTLLAYSKEFLTAMNQRSLRQIRLMQDDGIGLETEEFFQKAGGGPLYRAKLLDVLASRGLINGEKIMDLTDSYFGSGAPYEVKDTFSYKSFDEICHLIRQAGGKVVLAHPGRIKKKNQALYERLITDSRLDGLEVYHHHNKPEVRAQLLSIAAKKGLLITGGTDYHGTHQKNFRLPGDEFLPNEVISSMMGLLCSSSKAKSKQRSGR